MLIRLPLIFIPLLLLLSSCDDSSVLTSEGYVDRALQYYNNQKLAHAAIELQNALLKDPNNIAARLLKGKVSLELGDGATAVKEFVRALDLGANEDAVFPLLARAYLLTGELEKLDQLAPRTVIGAASMAELLAAKGVGSMNLGRPEEAEGRLREALQFNPKEPFAHTGLARLALHRGQRNECRLLLEQVLEDQPAYGPALSLLGDLEALEGNLDHAASAYRSAVSSRHDNTADIFKLALTLIGQGELDAAAAELSKLRAKQPDYGGVAYASGLLELAQNNRNAALESFEKVISGAGIDQFPQVYLYAGATCALINRLECASAYANKFHFTRPESAAGRRLLALVHVKQRDYDRVLELLRPLMGTEHQDAFTTNLYASTLIQLGDAEQGVHILKQLADSSIPTARSTANLGVTLMRLGEHEEGLAQLQTAIELDPSFDQAELALIFSYIQAGDKDAALAEGKKYVEQNPDSVSAFIALGFVYAARDEIEESRAWFEKAVAVDPGNATAGHQLALIAVAEQDYARAEQHYHRMFEHDELSLTAMIGLAKLAKHGGDDVAVKQWLDRAIDTHKTALQPRLLLARQLLDEGRPAQALESLSGFREVASDSPSFLVFLGEVQSAAGALEQANRTYQALVSLQPASAQAHFLLAKSYGALGDAERARSQLQTAFELDEGYLPARVAYAKLSARLKDWETLSKAIAGLPQEVRNSEEVVLLEVQMLKARKDFKEARSRLEAALKRSSTETLTVELAKTIWLDGNQNGALRILNQWLAVQPDAVLARRIAAEFYQVAGESEKARVSYETVLQYDPRDVIALNNLAELVGKNDPPLAYKYAKKAAQLQPRNLFVLDTLAATAAASGNLIQAEGAIDSALALAPDSRALIRRKISILRKMGKTDEAKQLLEASQATETR